MSTQSWSYREYDVEYGTPAYKAWEQWMDAHNIPLPQVPHKGWAARDIRRNTVSVLVYDWDPDEDISSRNSILHLDIDDDRVFAGAPGTADEFRRAVLTVQLEDTPLPFPEVPNIDRGLRAGYSYARAAMDREDPC